MRPSAVIVRSVPSTFDRCLRPAGVQIDVEAARSQHAGYVDAIRSLGIAVHVVAADDDYPDCVFIEDAAVVVGRGALSTRPGAPSRRGEVAPVAGALAAHSQVVSTHEPAQIEGGDVLRIGSRLFVGLSSRTNQAGVDALAAVAAQDGVEVIAVAVASGLHLKSAFTIAGPDTLVHAPGFDPSPFECAGVDFVEAVEPCGANVLCLGDTVLVSASAPGTAARLEARGLNVRSVLVDTFHDADGALTCLSLRVPEPGSWAT